VIVVGEGAENVVLVERDYDGAAVVSTPLDLIQELEDQRQLISTVVLLGRAEGHTELAAFLLDTYPSLRVLGMRYAVEPDAFAQLYA
jgi:hypothetical protein